MFHYSVRFSPNFIQNQEIFAAPNYGVGIGHHTKEISLWFERKKKLLRKSLQNHKSWWSKRASTNPKRPSQKRLDKKWMKSNQCVNINSNQISNKIYSQQFGVSRQTMKIYYEKSNANIFIFYSNVWMCLRVSFNWKLNKMGFECERQKSSQLHTSPSTRNKIYLFSYRSSNGEWKICSEAFSIWMADCWLLVSGPIFVL